MFNQSMQSVVDNQSSLTCNESFQKYFDANCLQLQYFSTFFFQGFLQSYITPLVEFAVDLYKRTWGTKELQIPNVMKAPYMRIVFLPEIFGKVYGTTQADGDRLVVEFIEKHNVVMIVTVVDGRLATRVSGQIFSTKCEYVYAANFIKRRAIELERQLQSTQ